MASCDVIFNCQRNKQKIKTIKYYETTHNYYVTKRSTLLNSTTTVSLCLEEELFQPVIKIIFADYYIKTNVCHNTRNIQVYQHCSFSSWLVLILGITLATFHFTLHLITETVVSLQSL